jgi:hypothetical protein
MTTDAIQLLRDHWSEVPQADEDTVERAYAYAVRSRSGRGRFVSNRTSTRPRLAAVLVVASLAGLAAAGFGVNALLQPSQHSHASTQKGPGAPRVGPPVFGANPFGEAGATITLDELKAAKSSPIAIPDSPLANSSNVGGVWLNTESGAAAAYWPSSGIEIAWGGTGVDYTGFPAEDIQTINGVRVILRHGAGANPWSSLIFPEPNGHVLELWTRGSIDDLISVAQTLPVYSNP